MVQPGPRKNTFIDEDASDHQSRKRWATAPDTMQLGGLGVEDESGGFLSIHKLF